MPKVESAGGGEPDPIAPQDGDRLIASRLHTAIVLAAVVAWAYGGMLSAARFSSDPHAHRASLFLLGIGQEWLMFALILIGVLRARTPLAFVTGKRWHSLRDLVRDVGIAAAFWLVAIPVLLLLRLLLGVANFGTAVLALLPRSALEIALWCALSVSAGICEEAVFRGYLQRQLMLMTGNKGGGMLLAAAAFGVAHVYQGWRMATVIGLYGLMFGTLAYWRGTVRPGMIAHGWQDTVAGVLGAIILRR